MSFFKDILSGVGSFLGIGSASSSNNIGLELAKTALMAFAVNQTNRSLAKENQALTTINPYQSRVDQGVRLQVDPDSDQKIPVCYGRSTLGGIITDARLSTDQTQMYYVLTISERTGTLLSTGADSAYVFNDIFLNDQRIIFKSDGITCDYTIDRDGNKDFGARDVVKVYCYAGNSETPQVPEYYSNGSLTAAYNVLPGWTANHQMSDLIFAVVQITYSPESGLTSVPNCMFNLTNSMTLPGDVLLDYLRSERYGCGVAPGDINT